MSIGKGILATTLSCGYSGYNIFLPDFFFPDCELSWSWGVDMPFLPLPKMQRAGIGFGRFTMWGGFAIGKCRSVPRIPNSWCIVFFKRAQPIIQKSYDEIFRLTNGCQAQQEENGEREESAISCFEFLQMPRVFEWKANHVQAMTKRNLIS